MQQQLLLVMGLQCLLSSTRSGAPCGAQTTALCCRSGPAGYGRDGPESRSGEKRTFSGLASGCVAMCVAASRPMKEEPAVLCQDAKVSSFSVIAAQASHLLSACEMQLIISCKSRWL